MNREIKFRAWNIPDKMMYYGVQNGLFFGTLLKDSGSVVMQYTGVKDKNGKEIYENDIIKYTQRYFNTEKTDELTKVVKFDFDRWNIFETGAGEVNIEIIGNIFENPNLLDTKNI